LWSRRSGVRVPSLTLQRKPLDNQDFCSSTAGASRNAKVPIRYQTPGFGDKSSHGGCLHVPPARRRFLARSSVVRHHASGWVREIARKDEDSEIEATFDPESGTVTVYEGRRDFKALERAARRSGLSKKRVCEYLSYRMLEVEAAANAVYAWAAQELLARRLAEERPTDPGEYASAVHREAQALRYRAHDG
jgi:hypothetical protein